MILFVAIFLVACSEPAKDDAPAQSSTAPQTTARASSSPSSLPIAVGHESTVPASSSSSSAPAAQGNASGLQWTAPSGWKTGPAGSSMRAATYLIPAAGGDNEGGECAVFKNIGGGVAANINRWISQFKQPDGSSSEAKAIQKKNTVNGLQVTTVDLTGTFTNSGMAMGQSTTPKPGYRLLGAIVETPQGDVFFKMTGPEKTIASAEADFQSLLKSIKLGG
ncbi:MAG: hypothetical protein L0220_07365 [Acidobacteria bacterium]|nr:hypothetical protein [Acidobacteriota bacterium]